MADHFLAPENDYSSLEKIDPGVPSLRATVVVPVFNRVELLRRTLAGVAVQTYPQHLISVVVADDGSEEDVASVIEGFPGSIPISLVHREHQGYGAGQARNLGAQAAGDTDVLIFIDADCIPDRELVERHLAWHHRARNLVVIGSRHHVDTGEIDRERIFVDPLVLRRLAFGTESPENWSSEDFRRVLHRRTAGLQTGDEAFRSLVSSNFSTDRTSFLELAGFSPDFRRWGGEDTELGWRFWNHGAYFIDEPRAAIYHQTQEDAGSAGWRQRDRSANDGLIQSKIPHRFYRSPAAALNESPKVSVMVVDPDEARLQETSAQLLGQRSDDLEIWLIGESPAITSFIERRSGDPRFHSSSTVEHAVQEAKGEFVALMSGETAIDHRLLSRSVSALEKRPRSGWVRSAYGIPSSGDFDVHRRDADISRIDAAWSRDLPLFGLTRRRDLMKGLLAGKDVAETWAWIKGGTEGITHGTPLVIVPAPTPGDDRPGVLAPPTSLRSLVVADLRAGGSRALTAPVRAVRSKITGSSYHAAPARSYPTDEGPSRKSIRYVGWTGRDNFGDEVMFDAVRALFGWADVDTSSPIADLLMLGGGTLINRGYLKHLRPLDSPRIERVAFGTGVAHPEYWGDPKEPIPDWVKFLDSCLFVGVRGPRSAQLLADWRVRAEVEVIGDPALSIRVPDVERVEGRVIVCPAWARGLLWGGSDRQVLSAFAEVVRSLRDGGHEVWALSAFPADDAHIIQMMREAGAPDLPYLAAHHDPHRAIELLATADVVVSERLHGAVLAAAVGTVPVMVEYRPKVRDFAQSIGLEQLVIRTDALAGGTLFELTEEAIAQHEALAAEMTRRVEEHRTRQKRAARRIEEAVE